MLRSDPIRFALGLLFVSGGGVVYLWTQPYTAVIRFWSAMLWLVACSALGFFIWWHALRVRAAIRDIPTAKLGSAAQGYVELYGKARRLDSRFSTVRPHYLWQRITHSRSLPWFVYRLFPFNLFFTPVAVDVTRAPFGFSDGSIEAVVLPEGAEVICRNRHYEYKGGSRVLTESIHSAEPIYLLGYLRSLDATLDVAAEAERVAADLRMNAAERARFDLDRDGRLSVSELLKLHEHAKQVVKNRQLAEQGQPQTHVICKPPDGRQYVISTLPVEQIANRYLVYAILGVILGISGLAAALAHFARFGGNAY